MKEKDNSKDLRLNLLKAMEKVIVEFNPEDKNFKFNENVRVCRQGILQAYFTEFMGRFLDSVGLFRIEPRWDWLSLNCNSTPLTIALNVERYLEKFNEEVVLPRKEITGAQYMNRMDLFTKQTKVLVEHLRLLKECFTEKITIFPDKKFNEGGFIIERTAPSPEVQDAVDYLESELKKHFEKTVLKMEDKRV